jgi:hypothetical protein
MENFISLFDHLGKPAGKELGLKVWEAARTIGIPTRVKQVSNPKYKGDIVMYPENWLIGYFTEKQQLVITDNDELPF